MDMDREASVDAYIDEVWDDVLTDIGALVAYASVADRAQAAPGAPFGPEVRSALDCALGIAERLGYKVSAILTILIPIHEHGMFFHLSVSSLISLSSVLYHSL